MQSCSLDIWLVNYMAARPRHPVSDIQVELVNIGCADLNSMSLCTITAHPCQL